MKGPKPRLDNVVPMKGDVVREAPEPPFYLREEAQRIWRELAPIMVAKGRLPREAEELFAVYCENVHSFIEATTTLALEGTFYATKTRNGLQKKRNPAAVHQAEAMNAMRRDSALFGLSPVDAARLATGGQGDLFEDLEAVLNGSRGN